ncbi:Protein of unknown function DUF1592 [Pedosphaera parvula Ellin514]|uniref:Cytochrome c domain-containing protein n=1 Tax=Pedosphaera parvula (strain Ellin514) TaxID=320771 RepID=B9XER8_PEDPL|nr:Protein of unknown function DUF1592 [Pedosphaera parvula Ellin514]
MRKSLYSLIGVLLLGVQPASAADAVAHPDPFKEEIRPLLDQYCAKCHGPDKAKAGVNFSSFTNSISVYHDIKLWEKVVAKVRDEDMPPEGKPQPTVEQRKQMVAWIEKSLKDLEEGRLPKDPGRVLIHRLSKTEYNCTVRDLLGVDSNPADKFPTEGGGGGGFDNNADTMFIPPILMERYLAAATEILDAAHHDKIFFAKKNIFNSDRATAKKIIAHFALQGFRRPAQKEEVDRLLSIYDTARKQGQDYEAAVKTALKGILVSPKFLFRVEQDRESSQPYPVSDYELASRLSYFLWSSMPDDELFALASKNKLHEPAVLEQQVQRMLRDRKSKVFSDSFAGQWLRVRELKTSAQPDTNKFPEYTPALRDAMYAEVIEFFNSVVQEDRSVMDILDANYTYLNEDLAQLYGIDGVHGRELQKVELKDANRGGVLGMSAVLTMTSYPLRTSPVLRGKWVLEQILGTPPPPPPPLVQSLPPNDHPVDGLTLRQQLEKHRSNPNCAGCHSKMDPLGFGLENFDAIGRWRAEIEQKPVDASGVMPSGEKFTGPAELKKVLLNRKDDFARNLTEKMLAYALGRGLEYYDVPTVKEITKKLAESNYRSSVLIAEIVKSYPFQYRRNQPTQQASN